ncbi:hypothetical protein ETAE_2274 [Edwardsiella piscicida]|uniref:Uncharacterized protein n=1 Tax=Edwardsiella piscicida TaxID=1263550 RepID=A0AAU8PGQ7_EDWPI|nr:hypothetical protein ETAE_2274 [Edwardsiella tarda EIB202]
MLEDGQRIFQWRQTQDVKKPSEDLLPRAFLLFIIHGRRGAGWGIQG